MNVDNVDTQQVDIAPTQELHSIAVKFTGSGSEYFRIWIVNLLLTLVTLGIYYPWAKARRMRYFWENTLVDGDPLGFHGQGKNFFFGNMVAGIIFGSYSLGASASPTGAVVALVLLAALWPVLFRSSMCFRLRNSSWRGLRFEFKGTLGAAYGAVLPAALPFLLMAVAGTGTGTGKTEAQSTVASNFLLAALVLSVALLPCAFFWLKRYQHSSYGFASEQTHFSATAGSFYKLWFKYFLAVLVCMFGFAGMMFVLDLSIGSIAHGAPKSAASASIGLLVLPVALLLGAMTVSYFESRLQNLVWSRTSSAHVQFTSDLRFGRLTAIRLKNWVLSGLTLGLYWPFAAVSIYRLRLEAISVQSSVDLSDVIVESTGTYQNAVGDAAGDFFGLDLGL